MMKLLEEPSNRTVDLIDGQDWIFHIHDFEAVLYQ